MSDTNHSNEYVTNYDTIITPHTSRQETTKLQNCLYIVQFVVLSPPLGSFFTANDIDHCLLQLFPTFFFNSVVELKRFSGKLLAIATEALVA